MVDRITFTFNYANGPGSGVAVRPCQERALVVFKDPCLITPHNPLWQSVSDEEYLPRRAAYYLSTW